MVLGLITLVAIDASAAGYVSDKFNQSATQAKEVAKSGYSIISIGMFLMGTVVMGWGAYDLFIDEDKQQQGKKTQGGLKLAGGFALVAITKLVSWAGGNTDAGVAASK